MMMWTYRDPEYIYLLIYVWCGMGSWKCYFAHLSLSNQRRFSSQELLGNHVHKYLYPERSNSSLKIPSLKAKINFWCRQILFWRV